MSSDDDVRGAVRAWLADGRSPLEQALEPGHAGLAAWMDGTASPLDVWIVEREQQDPAIYAETVRRHPGRVLAVGIREVRLDPGDGTVEAVTDGWGDDVPFVLAADSLTIARRLAELGLVDAACVAAVAAAPD